MAIWARRHHSTNCWPQFGEKGCPFAPGWQARTALADGKGIDPDGKVLLRTPWGRRWCNLEVELSDTSYSALKPRCGKYGSSHRRDDDPALFVCPDERAERNLHRAAAEFSPKPLILTTTLRRLKVGGVFGTGVWVEYGNAGYAGRPRLRNVGKGGALHGLVDGQFDGDELVNCFVPVVDLLGQLGKGVVLVIDPCGRFGNELSLMGEAILQVRPIL